MNYAICNETFVDWDHQRICTCIASLGYCGLEVAPFTLGPKPTLIPMNERLQFRETAENAGLQIIGLHWLLAKTTGLHLTHPEPVIREQTASYLVQLGKLCSDLGGSLMVLGSPLQRNRLPDISGAQAFEFALDTLQQVMPRLGELGIRLCIEPLGTAETNFINTCAEANELIGAVNHPLCVLHLDVKAMAAECNTENDGEAIAELIRREIHHTGHFHANDPNRRGHGFGAMPFQPIMQALRQSHYAGWVSVEVFDYFPDPETIARESLQNMKRAAEAMEN
ncbi:MAG TPA: sugar phosphate isomerase/epimerase family protein [Gemmatales bacterium]|nr:sugar phosphate isomerase/epimerase family protein [Gemmatales bacterium]